MKVCSYDLEGSSPIAVDGALFDTNSSSEYCLVHPERETGIQSTEVSLPKMPLQNSPAHLC